MLTLRKTICRAALASVVRATAYATIASLTTPCKAQDVTVWVYGDAQKTCGDFIAASENINIGTCMKDKLHNLISENCHFMEYAFGVISGTNHLKADLGYEKPDLGLPSQIENLSNNSLDLWLRNYCNSRPLSKFGEAVVKFIGESTRRSSK